MVILRKSYSHYCWLYYNVIILRNPFSLKDLIGFIDTSSIPTVYPIFIYFIACITSDFRIVFLFHPLPFQIEFLRDFSFSQMTLLLYSFIIFLPVFNCTFFSLYNIATNTGNFFILFTIPPLIPHYCFNFFLILVHIVLLFLYLLYLSIQMYVITFFKPSLWQFTASLFLFL